MPQIQFVNKITKVNTQAAESFNNCIKIAIKKQKGVKTQNRDIFLKVFLFFFNNREEGSQKRIKFD